MKNLGSNTVVTMPGTSRQVYSLLGTSGQVYSFSELVDEDEKTELKVRVTRLLADLARDDFDMALLDLAQLHRVLGPGQETAAGGPNSSDEEEYHHWSYR